MKRETHTIDAKNRILGRLATEIAVLLRGKNKTEFSPNKDTGAFVIIKNIGKIKLTGKKIEQKVYYQHSGYLGGLKETPLKKLLKENPEQVLKNAVWGMLPKNRLRSEMIKRLKFEK